MKKEINDKKSAILKATLELTAEHGLQGAPISQIAQKACVNVGSIYYYFTSKDEILGTLYRENKASLGKHLAKYPLKNDATSLPSDEMFKLLIRNAVHYYFENKNEFLFMEQIERSPLIYSTYYQDLMYANDSLVEVFELARLQNLVKDLPSEVMKLLFRGAVSSLIRYFIVKGEIDESILSSSVDAMWDMAKK